jgi:hypothetical protein
MSSSAPSSSRRRPAHQNSVAFSHNPHSRLTARIARIPNNSVCPRCAAIIDWRKRYRKYKPISAPRRCRSCQQRTVKAAYHHLCTACADSSRACAKCMQSRDVPGTSSGTSSDGSTAAASSSSPALTAASFAQLLADCGLRERRRRLLLRAWESGEKTDGELREMVAALAQEAGGQSGSDEDEEEAGD